MTAVLMILAILLPAAGGILIPLLKAQKRKVKICLLLTVLSLQVVFTAALLFLPAQEVTLFTMTEVLTVKIFMDGISKLFLSVAASGYLLAGIYAVRYMKHEEEGSFPEEQFFAFFLLSLAALTGMDMARNLVTMYFFFELITLLSMPLVLHERTKESVTAALKYLFYSVAGAFLALLCIFFLAKYCTTLDFTPGGMLAPSAIVSHQKLLSIVIFLGVMGFGAKAGLYPLHGWLPAAHPVAPAPASAILSGIIAKAGVLAIIRVIYYAVGVSFLQDTWVQYAWISVALLTIFMGSMMAYREKNLKKRLAYSSVSQISYILFGLFLFTETGLLGALEQFMFHACVKICLFMIAGSFIVNKGFRRVDELTGIGKTMPFTLGAFTLASLSLIGIPPFAGFVSKWYLAEGALESGLSVLSWLGPVVLLVSALLTAGYLLPIAIAGFFPGKKAETEDAIESAPAVLAESSLSREGGLLMVLPILITAVLSLLFGLFGGSIDALILPIIQ